MCDAKLDELVSEYEFIGIKATQVVLDTSMRLCKKYNLSAEDFISQWSAFTLSHLNRAAPDVDSLLLLDRKILALEVVKPDVLADLTPKKQLENVITPKEASATPKNEKKRPRSPLKESQSTNSQPINNTLNNANNDSISLSGPSYAERRDIGKVVVSFGKWANYLSNFKPAIKLFEECNIMSSNDKYMYEMLPMKSTALKTISDHCCASLLKKHNLSIKYGANTAGNICICGRILLHGEGKLSKTSVTVHFSYEKYDVLLEMNASKLDSFSLFPGQIIAATGNLTSENKFTADHIYIRNFPEKHKAPITLEDSLNIIVAAGPFTTLDNFLHEPLQDLLKYVLQEQPHILMLIGPFIVAEHTDNDNIPTTYDEFFEQVVETVMSHVVDTNIQVVLIPSHLDLHHHTVYPTPPYALTKDFDNLHLVPDPCILDICGILIAATSVDVLMQLGAAECCEKAGDRFQRLVGHVMSQRSFYPLYPAACDVPVDYTRLGKYGGVPVLPDVVVVPSKFFSFIKKVDSCLAINPERLTKFRTGGSFARIQVSPPKNGGFPDVACEIIKI